MKRWLLAFLFILPSVAATISLNSINQEAYSAGDKVTISGYLIEEQNTWGTLQFDLECEEKLPLLLRAVNVIQGEKIQFSEDLSIPLAQTGQCFILVSLLTGSTVIDQSETEPFDISNELLGEFSLADNNLQLGHDLIIDGMITKTNGQPTDGTINMILKQNNIPYIMNTYEFNSGVVNIIFNTKDILPGEYTLDLQATEIFGNTKLFENIASFTVTNQINVFLLTNKKTFYPEDTLTIEGEANTLLQKDLIGGTAYMTFDEFEYKTEVDAKGQFSYKLLLPKDISSGIHTIKALVTDAVGNRGEGETKIEIITVPTSLNIDIEKSNYQPNEEITINPLLYDQAGDSMEGAVSLEIRDSKNSLVHEQTVSANTKFSFPLQLASTPGTWKVSGEIENVEAETTFQVKEITSFDIQLENGILIIKNTGNLKHTDPIDIKIKGEEGFQTTLTKKKTLKPQEGFSIDLTNEVTSGFYDIAVLGKTFDHIYIEEIKGTFQWKDLFWIGVIVGIIFILFILLIVIRFFANRKYRHHSKQHPKDVQTELHQKMMQQKEKQDKEIRKHIHIDPIKKSKNEGFVVLGKEHIKKEQKKEEPPQSPFSMFD